MGVDECQGRIGIESARMGLVLATTAGLVIWIVLWSLGYSGLDSGLLALVTILLGASGRIAMRYLPGGSARPPER